MNGQFAFVFPGQGSQQVGMLNDFAVEFPIILEVFKQASESLNYDLWHLIQENPQDKLNQTEYTQPALLSASVAIWRLWQQQKAPMPKLLAGHSLGEYTALVCAESLEFQTAVELVALRGKLMQKAVPAGVGGMAAIVGLGDPLVEELCEKASREDQRVTLANFNSIGQVVIAGNINAVIRAISLAKESGAKLAKQLPVSVPSHCSLMKSAAVKLEEKLQLISFNQPNIPVIHNADVGCYHDTEQIKHALVRQLFSPVRWVETIQLMIRQQIHFIFECGPGKVLTGLNKRISENVTAMALNNTESFNEALTSIGEAV